MKILNPKKIKQAEIAVGLPSFKEEKTIKFVAENISLGLERFFPKKSKVLVNVDNNSPDRTKEEFLKSKGEVPKIYISTKKRGKGRNVYNFFLICKKLNVKYAALFDADLKNITPLWVKKMLTPLFKNYHFVAPYYYRLKTDATITNHLVYPLIYGVLKWNIRQPIGGEFGFSSKMIDWWLNQKWTESTFKFGVDVFLTLEAYFSKLRTCQVFLGVKLHNPSAPKLNNMFLEVAKTLFDELQKYSKELKTKKIKPKKPFFFNHKRLPSVLNQNNSFNISLFYKNFLCDFKKIKNKYPKIIKEDTLKEIKKALAGKEIEVNSDLWARIVNDCMRGYFEAKKEKEKRQILEVLRCFYFGRVVSFFKKIKDMSIQEAEKEVSTQAKKFKEVLGF